MQPIQIKRRFPWRTAGALFFFVGAIVAFELGVTVSERPAVAEGSLLSKAYYALTLFVVGGADLGTPEGGSLPARMLLWLSFFGAPILAASTLIEALLKAIAPRRWQFRRLKDHIVVVGHGELTFSYLRVLRKRNPRLPVVVVSDAAMESSLIEELKHSFDALVMIGDITHEYCLDQLKVQRARKILLLDDNSLRSYEAASKLLQLEPEIGPRVVIHCGNLRFMRAMSDTRVARQCETFNTYHLAAAGLVRSHMIQHFRETRSKDVVIIAGFGRFGQTILEELQRCAIDELATVFIIDRDARRRVLVADEQMAFSGRYRREIYDGDISHPEVWRQVSDAVEVRGDNTVFVLGTGREEDNLRTALWLRRKYPLSMVISRSSKESLFASEVGQDHNIISISINELVEDNIPGSWAAIDG
ncbi:NAD-binding protein [Parahaliea aestuarii]|uniref:Potassium transporter TrkA n=1 Tax=Parahaliea aestuarii TaxID=1852021 RepID=A0A5C8ZU62_9GAMM|nr:NAD-binding protein [Parahaliea aestuarii]TXS91102.1 potassium transporter TrkA [Parahaliea aestuarii]